MGLLTQLDSACALIPISDPVTILPNVLPSLVLQEKKGGWGLMCQNSEFSVKHSGGETMGASLH